MGAPKQKWTAEEEAALRAGVEKHGPGKWRTIQKDPDFAPCLASRSNVDLKDKWRNLNVGSSGYGSRSLKIFSKSNAKQANEPIAAVPTACLPPDTLLLADTPRYENLVVEAIHGLSDPNGSSLLFIASYIEERYPVPSDFRRLLGIKLREMVIRGVLIKWKQNFKVNDASLLHGTSMAAQEGDGNGQMLKICAAPSSVRAVDPESQAEVRHANPRQTIHRPYKNARGEPAVKKTRVDGNYARSKLRTLEAAAIAASAAVAEAEAAAAAAEQAAREAEAAEAEAEAAEIAAEIAALAVRRTNEMPAVAFAWDKLAVTG